jgi:DNA-binding protein
MGEGRQVPANVDKLNVAAEAMGKAEKNVVLVGVKPIMNYVIACVTVFNAGGNDVCVKARGRAISRAVDTVELLRRAFVKDLTVKEIRIGTEEITREEGRKSNVSTIEITLSKLPD